MDTAKVYIFESIWCQLYAIVVVSLMLKGW